MATPHAHSAPAAPADYRPTQPLRDEHRALRPLVTRLQTLADPIGEAPVDGVRRGLDQAYDFLAHQLVPQAAVEDRAIHPEVARLLGSSVAIATTTREHEEVGQYAQQVGAVRAALAALPPGQPPERTDQRHLRRLLYGACTLVMAHLANEEAVFMPLLDAKLTPDRATRMYEAAGAAARQLMPRHDEAHGG
jgi:hypothetical protein